MPLLQLFLVLTSAVPILLAAVWVVRMLDQKISLREIFLFMAYCAIVAAFYGQLLPRVMRGS